MEWNPKERVGQPKPVTYSIPKTWTSHHQQEGMGCVDQNFFEGLWDFISVFVEDDKCKERVGGRGMNERDENRDERRDSEERNGTNR